MSLGTNDAVGGALDVKKRVTAIVAAADAQGVKLYWIGPPCVLKPWQTHSKELDKILNAQLAGTSVVFVSMQDAEFCAPSVHASDGVHFTMAGYRLMWRKAATVAGVSVAMASAKAPGAAPHPVHHHAKHHHHPGVEGHGAGRNSSVAKPTPSAPN